MAVAFDDLEPCTLFPSEWGTLAVGWLTKDRPYAKGTVALELMRALHRLGQPSSVLGVTRQCELCPPGTAWREGGLLFVPSARGLFVAPRLLLHSIRTHGYLPPAEFLAAVRECPPGDSAEYRAALEAGPGGAQQPQPRAHGGQAASYIQVFPMSEAVRLRPGMYVGSTTIDGMRECFRMVVHQAVAEHVLRFATRVRVEIDDGWLTVGDDGRGVGTGFVARGGEDRPLLEVVFSDVLGGMNVAAGGRRARANWMPGLSIGVANALSSRMEVTSHGEGATQRAVFECGRLLSLDRVEELAPQGLRIRCLLDPLIFDAKLDPRHVEEELTQLAWLCPRLEFTFQGRAVPNKEGPLAWVRALAPGFVEETGLTAHQDVGAIHVDVGLGWRPNQSAPNLVSLVNFLRTSGGSHEEGLLTALRQEAERRGIAGERVLAGLTAVVHVGFDYPPLEGERAGPTLESPEAAAAVAQTVTRVLDAAPWWWDRLCEVM